MLFIVFLAKETAPQSSEKSQKWICWLSTYFFQAELMQDIDLMKRSIVCELEDVRQDTIPSVQFQQWHIRINTLTSNRSLKSYRMKYAAIAIEDTEIQPLNLILEKTYTFLQSYQECSFSATAHQEKRDTEKEFLLVRPAADAKKTLPLKLLINQSGDWQEKAVDEMTQQLIERSLPPDERSSWIRLRDRIEPGRLCEACSRVINGSELLTRVQLFSDDPSDLNLTDDSSSKEFPIEMHRGFAVFDFSSGRSEKPNSRHTAYSVPRDSGTQYSCSGYLPTSKRHSAQESADNKASRYPQHEHHAHHRSAQDFVRAVLRGCHLCTLFWDQMDEPTYINLELLMRDAIGEHALSTEEPQTDRFEPYPDFEGDRNVQKLNDAQLLSAHDDNEWLPSRTDDSQLYVRLSSELTGAKYDTAISLYRPDKGTLPKWKTDVELRKSRAADKSVIAPEAGDQIHETEPSALPTHIETRFTSSPETFRLARRWLADCLSGHECWFPYSQSNPPTRVIDTCPSGSDSDILRVHLTSREDHGMRYLALSHCWGTAAKPLELTSKTFDILTQGFTLEDLPETFRDAVRICRALSVRYIWIDSLCIVQDDSLDWEREATKMADVYGNSVCTIAAESSHSVHSGCFMPRNVIQRVGLTWSNGHGEVFNAVSYRSDDINLKTRGWVFQERLLSPRTLSFSSRGIAWICRQVNADEINVSGLSEEGINWNKMISNVSAPRLQPMKRPQALNTFLMAWYELAEEYTKLKLTKKTDILFAIHGIATKIARATRYNFYYGLWHNIHDPRMLLSQLLWMAASPKDPRTPWDLHEDRMRPPTFSWAINFGSPIEHCITFHDRILNPTGERYIMGRSTFIKLRPKSDVVGQSGNAPQYLEIRTRNRTFFVDGHAGQSPFIKTEISFPTQIIGLHVMTEFKLGSGEMIDVQVPMLTLKGRVRTIRLKRLPNAERLEQWEYPWHSNEDSQACGDANDMSCNAWFFPDTYEYFLWDDVEVKCLTIAKWRRDWDGRWYVAGLVLSRPTYTIKGETRLFKGMERIGYFEHSWSFRHPHWDDDGQVETVLLV